MSGQKHEADPEALRYWAGVARDEEMRRAIREAVVAERAEQFERRVRGIEADYLDHALRWDDLRWLVEEARRAPRE